MQDILVNFDYHNENNMTIYNTLQNPIGFIVSVSRCIFGGLINQNKNYRWTFAMSLFHSLVLDVSVSASLSLKLDFL